MLIVEDARKLDQSKINNEHNSCISFINQQIRVWSFYWDSCICLTPCFPPLWTFKTWKLIRLPSFATCSQNNVFQSINHNGNLFKHLLSFKLYIQLAILIGQ